ncbi:PHD finger protein 7 [Drosophila ficusphila]|uniref:PHD finger protein 7 n=1 Tax=Drosophila ficusphila TaxID=30025 RepID=UPI0007E5E370|nr:PHD finger protein 7 [Drosophila ficusphila]
MIYCVLCRSAEDDDLALGTIHKEGSFMVHRNCLYLSSNLVQRGSEDAGILRFLRDDILAEVCRTRSLNCYYCHRPGANIGCCKSGCRRTFHTKCGVDNLAQNQFRDTYKSYCHQHVRSYRWRPSSDENCVICAELVIAEGSRFCAVRVLQSPCCRNGWYHRKCLQKYANSAGYFFKCPLCNNSTTFHDVALWGISVPNQDASWETEPNAFVEHIILEDSCTALRCLGLSGRISSSSNLLYCNLCGSNPVHAFCTVMPEGRYVCIVCAVITPTNHRSNESDEESSSSDYSVVSEGRQATRPTEDVNNTTDLFHSKLQAAESDDSDTEDDEDVFQRAIESKENQSQTVPVEEKPTTSAAAEVTAAASPKTESSPCTPPILRRGTRRTQFISSASTDNNSPAPRRQTRRSSRQGAVNNQENNEPAKEATSNSPANNPFGRVPRRSRFTVPPTWYTSPTPRGSGNGANTENREANKEIDKEPEAKKRHVSPSTLSQPGRRRYLSSMTPGSANSRSGGNNNSEGRMTLRRSTMHSTNRGNLDVSCVANRTRNRLSAHLASAHKD